MGLEEAGGSGCWRRATAVPARGGRDARALLLAVSGKLEERHWRDIKSTFSICPIRKYHRNQQPDPAWQSLLGLFIGTEAGKLVGSGRNTLAWSMAVSHRKAHCVVCQELGDGSLTLDPRRNRGSSQTGSISRTTL